MMNSTCHRTREIGLLVEEMCRRFPWYGDLVATSRYPASGRFEDLPFVTDDLLLANYYHSGWPERKDGHAYLTSGTTTGRRKQILWSAADHAAYVDDRTRILGNFLSKSRVSACADLGTGHAAASAIEVFTRIGLRASSIDFSLPLSRHVALLNEFEPDVLFTMPMILDRILATGELRARIKQVIVLGDHAPASWRRNVACRLGIEDTDVLDLYGSIEVGSIAHLDCRCGRYRFGPHIIPELVPSPRQDTKWPPSTGLLALTSLARESFPAIRYVTGDVIEGFAQSVDQGGGTHGFRAIIGRDGGDLKHGEKVSVASVTDSINSVLDGADFEIRRNDRSIVIYVNSPGFDHAAGERIVALIRKANPATDQMIASGLVPDIGIRRMEQPPISAGAKRSVLPLEG